MNNLFTEGPAFKLKEGGVTSDTLSRQSVIPTDQEITYHPSKFFHSCRSHREDLITIQIDMYNEESLFQEISIENRMQLLKLRF